MRDVIMIAPDISCEHCQKTIEAGLAGRPGVSQVTVDIPATAVHVRYDASMISEQGLEAELDELGYPVSRPT